MPPDYSGQNLRGRSFKGQDLTGANFSQADIRGANFTNANLKGADFTGAKAGLQRRWVIGLLIITLLLSALPGLFSTASVSYVTIDSSIQGISIGLLVLAFTGVVTCSVTFTWRSLNGDKRDTWLRSYAIVFAATGGTSFHGADLTDADFTGATLKNT
ncbi:MAG: pentapeptide repeat-containing protein, partial [Dolichospermum sp.]